MKQLMHTGNLLWPLPQEMFYHWPLIEKVTLR